MSVKVSVRSLTKNAAKARDVAVIIDVLRACTIFPFLFERGVPTIVPVESLDSLDSFDRKEWVFVGGTEDEKTAAKCFDYNNSPWEIITETF